MGFYLMVEIKVVEKVVGELVGLDAMPVVEFLIKRNNISEFIIAEELDLEVNVTRNILYRCYEHNILVFERRKDKRKGWYICYWSFNEAVIPHLVQKIRSQKLAHLKKRLEQEQKGVYYMCNNACTRMEFPTAMEFNFHCPECNSVMQEQDNARTVAFIEKRICELSSADTF